MGFGKFIKTCITPTKVKGDYDVQSPSGSVSTSARNSLPEFRVGLSSRGAQHSSASTAESIAPRQALPRKASEAHPSQQASTTWATAGAQAPKQKKTIAYQVKKLLGHGSKGGASTSPVPASACAPPVVTDTPEFMPPRRTLPSKSSEAIPSQQSSTPAPAQDKKKGLKYKAMSFLRTGHRSKSEAPKSSERAEPLETLLKRPSLRDLLRETAIEAELELREERKKAELLALVEWRPQEPASSGDAGASMSGVAPQQATSEQPTRDQAMPEEVDGIAAPQPSDALAIVPAQSQPKTPRPTVASFSEVAVAPQVMEALRRGPRPQTGPLAPSNDTLAIVPVGWTYPDERAGPASEDAPERAPTDESPRDRLSNRDTLEIVPFEHSQFEARESISPPRRELRGPEPRHLPAPPRRWLRTEQQQSDQTQASTSAMPSSERARPSTPLSFPASNTPALSDVSHVIDIPNDLQISEQLRQIFSPHINDSNRREFDDLITDRAQTLHKMGETPQSIDAVLAKGGFRDYMAQATCGFVRSVPFGVTSRVFDVVPALTSFVKTPAQIGAMVGGLSGAADTAGCAILKPATSDIAWLTSSREQLVSVMAEAKDAAQPCLTRLAAEVSGAFQAYTVRNVIRTGVAPLAQQALGAIKAANLDSWIAAAGSPIAGSAAYLAMQYMNNASHRSGPEYLLGRTDWKDQYESLKKSGPTDPLKSFAARAVRVPLDAVAHSLGMKDLFTGTNLIKNGAMLAGGFAGVLSAKTAVGEAAVKAGFGPAAVSGIKQGVNTALSAPLFAAWTTADVRAGSTLDSATRRITDLADRMQAAGTPNPPTRPDHVVIDID